MPSRRRRNAVRLPAERPADSVDGLNLRQVADVALATTTCASRSAPDGTDRAGRAAQLGRTGRGFVLQGNTAALTDALRSRTGANHAVWVNEVRRHGPRRDPPRPSSTTRWPMVGRSSQWQAVLGPGTVLAFAASLSVEHTNVTDEAGDVSRGSGQAGSTPASCRAAGRARDRETGRRQDRARGHAVQAREADDAIPGSAPARTRPRVTGSTSGADRTGWCPATSSTACRTAHCSSRTSSSRTGRGRPDRSPGPGTAIGPGPNGSTKVAFVGSEDRHDRPGRRPAVRRGAGRHRWRDRRRR